MKRYNWNSINESFFDDIENDIESDYTESMNGLYSKTFKQCETVNDFVEFFEKNLNIKELFKISEKWYEINDDEFLDNSMKQLKGEFYNVRWKEKYNHHLLFIYESDSKQNPIIYITVDLVNEKINNLRVVVADFYLMYFNYYWDYLGDNIYDDIINTCETKLSILQELKEEIS